MTLIVAGTVRVPADRIGTFRPYMQAMIEHSRSEDGCIDYAYAQDVLEPGLIHVFEVWRDRVALETHFKSPHLAEWRAAWGEFGVSDRNLIAYEVASQSKV